MTLQQTNLMRELRRPLAGEGARASCLSPEELEIIRSLKDASSKDCNLNVTNTPLSIGTVCGDNNFSRSFVA